MLAAAGAVAFALQWFAVGGAMALLTAGVASFFRDPDRIPPADPNAVVSPADGRVIECVSGANGAHRIAIFLAVWNVHVNRVPYGGSVADVEYVKGKFLAAFNPEAGARNEQNRVSLDTPRGRFVVTQIAGYIARRIVCRAKPGDTLARGERFGLIQFGSRVDCEIPPGATPCVKKGDAVRAGETIIARFAPKGGHAA